MLFRFLFLMGLAVLFGVYFAIRIVRADQFPLPYNSEADLQAQPMDAAQAANAFVVPAGIQAKVFAAEPEVQNPIAMAWDGQGRLWIAENYTYAERSQRFDLSLRDRVLVFSDDSGDGIADRRQVFTDQVQMLTGIEVGHGGVWLMCPPQLLFIPDRDGDGTPDAEAEVVLDGFDVAEDNYHNLANGLRWGPDGWLYGRCGGSCPGRVGKPGTPDEHRIPLEGGIWRYHIYRQHFEVLVHGTTNPWGHDWDRWGECFFVNTVNGHFWHLIPGAHFDRPFTLDPNPWVFELLDMHADHWHFDTGGEWFLSRGGAANDYGGGHAHIGAMIYQADNWPARFRDRFFTWNMHGQRANQEKIERRGSGYIAQHAEDVLLAKDPFFRGMELTYGPSGAVYAIDWSDTGECHEATGVHRTSGRIFCFSSQSATEGPTMDLRELSSLDLAQLLNHSNQWYVRQARLLLSERAWRRNEPGNAANDRLQSAVDRLFQNLYGDNEKLTYESLLTLHAMGLEIDDYLGGFLGHANEHLRVWAIRLLLDFHAIDDIHGKCGQRNSMPAERLAQFVSIAERDQSGLVRLALASGIQRLSLEDRAPLARALMSRVEDAEDHNLPILVWYGLMPFVEARPSDAVLLAVDSQWPKTQRFLSRRIASLIEESPEALNKLIAMGADVPRRDCINILRGISEGLAGWRQVIAPSAWPHLVDALQPTATAVRSLPALDKEEAELKSLLVELGGLFGQGRAWQEISDLLSDEKADISLRRAALETLVKTNASGQEDLYLSLLRDARLNGLAARGLSASSDVRVSESLIKNYFRFRSPERSSVISILCSRPNSAWDLLQAISAGKIPVHHLTPYDARQVLSMGDSRLAKLLVEVWGEIRQSDSEKRTRIEELKNLLASSVAVEAQPSRGRVVFEQRCAACHRLFGSGHLVGPDLTGANRTDWDYLLENIIDPSAVVSRDYRMSLIKMEDGRVLSGLVLLRTPQSLELRTQTDRLTLSMEQIEQIQLTGLSPMPDGLLDNLTEQQLRDLFSYLRHPTQVPLPEE
jgi:putative membrane-bound dehydrogenase-like protein